MDNITYFCILLMIALSSEIYYIDEDATIIVEEINIEEEMKKAEIVPDVVPRGPKKLLRVQFPQERDLIPGQRLFYSQIIMQPEFFYDDYESETYYTMYMTRLTRYADTQEHFKIDPFYNLTYGRDELGFWIIINMWENNTLNGRTLVEYETPLDPYDRRTCDRFAFFVFKQKYEITELPEPEERSIYLYGELPKTAAFAKKYDLGDPLYGNYFVNHW
ncbi:putative odorant-binding protein A5 [Planococcus citri]|uniref:putative odorant-binding protein A5 n=1 Tax=Planococcus citri TaxID=170843 RepID=UPI0031F7BB16